MKRAGGTSAVGGLHWPALLAAAAVGAVVAVGAGRCQQPNELGRDSAWRDELVAVEGALEREGEARARLEEELRRLEARLEALGRRGPNEEGSSGAARAAASGPAAAEDGGAPSQDGSSVVGGKAPSAPSGSLDDAPWFDTQQLVAAGLPEGEAQALHDRWDEHQMEALRLQDRILRQDDVAAARQELRDLTFALRDELDGDDYDHLLYASGQRNRVVVQDVLESSPGRAVGLERGDVILYYNDARIFHPHDLRQAISESPRGSLVWLEAVSPDGARKQLQIPGGPIGIRMTAVTRTPEIR